MGEPHDGGLFGPGSTVWKVHGDPAALLGGLRALLLQALHPLAMAGVEEHSTYRSDPWLRLRQTSDFLMVATFGSTDEARAMGRVVRRAHAHVQGTDPVTGRPYRASDRELLAWVHNVLVHSLLLAADRYGPGMSAAEGERYLEEAVALAELVGCPAELCPTTRPALRRYFDEVRASGTLLVSPSVRQAQATVLTPPMPLVLRPLWAVPAAAAVNLLPGWARDLYGLRWPAPADPAVRAAVKALAVPIRVLTGGPPHERDARRRLAAA